MTDFFIKKGDLRPAIQATLEDEDGNAIDISDARDVYFYMMDADDNVKVDANAIGVDPANGVVEYNWNSGDTDTAGFFRGEFELEWDDGDRETFPNHAYIDIQITDDIS